jgi:hypothetical protein
MQVIVSKINANDWLLARKLARITVNKQDINTEVSSSLKKKLVILEHSPLREIRYLIELFGIPTTTAQQMSRHRIAIQGSSDFMQENVKPTDVEHFVTSQRPDICGKERGSQLTPVNYSFTANVNGLIDMSKVRLCLKAESSTIKIWSNVVNQIKNIDNEAGQSFVQLCVYRGFCPYFKQSCGYDFELKRKQYLSYYGENRDI